MAVWAGRTWGAPARSWTPLGKRLFWHVDNHYSKPGLQRLLDKRPQVLQAIWKALRQVGTKDLVSNGRTYGGGLHKMEPKELENVRIYLGEPAQTIVGPARQRPLFDVQGISE